MPHLIVSKSSNFYNMFPLKDEIIRIGKLGSNDIIFDSEGVSREHARLEHNKGKYILYDEDSTNGTFVGEKRLKPLKPHPLSHGASFRILDYMLTYADDSEQARPKKMVIDDKEVPSDVNGKEADFITTAWAFKISPLKPLEERISHIIKLGIEISSLTDQKEIMKKSLDALFEILHVKKGFVALKSNGDEPTFFYKNPMGHKKDDPKLKISQDIAVKVIEEGYPIYQIDAVQDASSNDIYGMPPGSVICEPLFSNGVVIGCIYLDNPDKGGCFTLEDRDIVAALSGNLAEAINSAKEYQFDSNKRRKRIIEEVETEGIIVRNEKTLELYENIEKYAKYNLSVLIHGESGTGKEHVANHIHKKSGRSGKFVAININVIPANRIEDDLFGHVKGAFTGAYTDRMGLFEEADMGTLFLDEIGEMDPSMQPKLLRALEDNEIRRLGSNKPIKIDVRIVSATNRDIHKEQTRNDFAFRHDLYYRLNKIALTTLPLRERKDEIKHIAHFILKKEFSKKPPRLSHRALKKLESCSWSGNVRQLINIVQSAAIKVDGGTIKRKHLDLIEPAQTPSTKNTGILSLDEAIREHIIQVLANTNNNKSETARKLGTNRNRLGRLIEKYNIKI